MKDVRTYASYLVAAYERVTGNAFKNEPLYLQKLLILLKESPML